MMKNNKEYQKLEKQEEKLDMKKKKLKEAAMDQMIRDIVRSELNKK
jgi:cell division protein FtsB